MPLPLRKGTLENVRSDLESAIHGKEKVRDLMICATNINTGEPHYFTEGDFPLITIASSTLPPVFRPVCIDGEYYIDGGYTDNLPTRGLKEKHGHAIAVNVNDTQRVDARTPDLEVIKAAVNMMVENAVKRSIAQTDLYLKLTDVTGYSLFDFDSAKEIREKGYLQTKRLLVAP